MNIMSYRSLALAVVIGSNAPLSASTLLKTHFEGGNTLSGMTGYFQTAGGSGTATPTVAAVGTVNSYGTLGNTDVNNTASNGLKLLVNSQSATGTWTAGVDSGILQLLTPNTITNPGLLTLSFSLWSSRANPILVRLESYDATTNLRTGGLKTLIYPAAPNFYQRFALDLSTMTADGTGTFIPNNNSKIKIYFEIGNTLGGDGWPNASGLELHVDNLNYSTPKYYVRPSSSNDSPNTGLTESSPWKTISKAVNAAVPGDIIVLMGSEADPFVASGTSGLASFQFPGAPDAWIVLKNYPGQQPVLRSAGWNTISIGRGANGARYTASDIPCYIEVRGLTVRGYSSVDANGDRQIAAAYKSYVGLSDSRSNNNGISIDGRYTDYYLHDFRIADNLVEYCTGGGISAIRSDRTAVENNISRYNTWWSIYGGSGISYLVSIDTELNSDYRMLIQGNEVYGNEGMIPWRSVNGFSDGNGIIVDTNQLTKSTYNFSNAPDYAARTLVQNNLVYHNGGSGIHAFQASHVDIVHNTAYRNSASPRLNYSQIYAGYSKDVRMMNNILVAPNNPTGNTAFNEPITTNSSNTAGTIYYQNNVFYGEGNNQAIPTNANFINNSTGNPLFLSPSDNPATNDFHLRLSSPALNNGLNIGYRSALDYAGRPRLTTNTTPDRGAYQKQAGDLYAPVFTPQPGNYTVAQSVTLASDSSGVTFVYTTNGSEPTVDAAGTITNGSAYTAAIPVGTAAATLKAIAWKSGFPTSYVSTAGYTFNTTQVAIPALTLDVAPATDDGTQYVSVISATPGALVRYTTDGSTPTASSGTLAAASAIKVTTANIIKAIAYKSGRTNSPVISGNFVIRGNVGSMSEGTATEAIGLNKIRFSRFHPAANLTATRIYAKVGAITGSYRTAIYADSGGVPGALLKASAAAVTNPATGWQAFTLTAAQDLVRIDSNNNDVYYWLAIWSDNAASSIYKNTTGGTLRETTSAFSAAWPTPVSASTSVSTANYSIFATTSYRPVVSAGSNQVLTSLALTASLAGASTDNSTPAVPLGAGSLATAWSKVSGPGTVTFGNSASLATTATFSQLGTYVLRLTGQENLFTPFAPVTSEVTITLNGPVAGDPTVTTLTASDNPATLAAPLILTASVTSTTGVPTGTVRFFDGVTQLGSGTLNGSGVASLTTNTLSVGNHSLTASYDGNASFAVSTSASLLETVNLADGTTRTFAINSGGVALSSSGFTADGSFTGGAITSTTSAIDLSAVDSPAPGSLYQTERYGTGFSYTLTGLAPSTGCRVRLHFSENWWGVSGRIGPGKRFFNVSINGVQRLTSFEIHAAAGAPNKAVIREMLASADASGQLVINFAGAAGSPDPNALVDGIEVYSTTPLDAWRCASFNPAQLDDAGISGLLADADGDGSVNLLEYALGTDPAVAGSVALPVAGIDGDGLFTLTFERIADPSLLYDVQGSSNMMTWTSVGSSTGAQNVEGPVTFPDLPPSGATGRFLRLRVSKP